MKKTLPLPIMKRISLSEHIRQSKIAVAANKIKGNRHGQILSMLYADPYHFIEEIIQNTEDACRNNPDFENKGVLRVVIHNDAIDIFHNGKPFSEQDLMAISTFAVTSKKGYPNINMIGKFGIGFRSVYGISENPEIHSGKYHFKILDYEVLEECSPRSTHDYTTLIRLPFKKNLDTAIIKATTQKLLELDHTLLLFLTHLHQIEIESEAQRLRIRRQNSALQKDVFHSYLESNGKKQKKETFLLFRKNTHALKECAIAFKLGNDSIPFESVEYNPISVYFPTRHRLNHSFLIHARFTTNPTREQIIFNKEHCPENYELSKEIGTLLQKSLKYLRKENKLNSSFWRLFDWNSKANDPLHEELEHTIYKFFHEEKSLLNIKGEYKECKNLCMPEHPILRSFIQKKEIFTIWSRFDFLHEQYNENQDFIQYLRREHKLKMADIDSLAFHIRQRPEFLKKKKFQELNLFYEMLSQYPKYWDLKHADRYYSLRQSPLIPDMHKNLMPPYHKDGSPAIFLGAIKGKVPLVHPDLANLLESRNFFAMLGIPESSPELTEAEKLIQGLRIHNANPTLFKLFKLFSNGNTTLKDRITKLLSKTNCIRVIFAQNGEKAFVKPYEAYIPSLSLQKFFAGKNIAYVALDLFRYFENKGSNEKELKTFLIHLGVNEFPAKIPLKNSLDEAQKKLLRDDIEIHPIVKETIDDFSIDGLDDFLNKPSFEKSKALWELICSMPENYFTAKYTFESYVRSETVIFTPYFIQILKKTAFLYDQNLQAKTCSNISLSELHNDYRKTAVPDYVLRSFDIDASLLSSLSQKEEEFIRYLRKTGLDPFEIIAEKENKKDPILHFIDYVPTKIEKNSSDGLATMNQLATLTGTIPFQNEFQADIEALDFYLKNPTQIIKEHLLRNVYANSKNINIEENSGILRIFDRNHFLTYVFIGLAQGNQHVLMHPKLEELLLERENRLDIILYIMQDRNCIKVESKYAADFIRKNIILTLKRMKFSR